MNKPAASPFQSLFASYLNNQIDDLHWNRFQAVCDLTEIYPSERIAFATFFSDSISNNEKVCLPKACEAALLLDEIRVDEIGMASGY